MKAEYVGGPRDGEVVTVRTLEKEIVWKDEHTQHVYRLLRIRNDTGYYKHEAAKAT